MIQRLPILALTLLLLATAATVSAQDATNSVPAPDTAPENSHDYAAFRDVFSKRNIFDPTRTGRNRNPNRRTTPPRVDSFTLVGTMSSGKSLLAFFDGNSSEYRKTLKPSETIAGYKITEITPNFVLLAGGSNKTINLSVGTRMRRQEGGRWQVSGSSEPEAETPPPPAADASASNANNNAASPAETPPSGAENDIIARLMAKRLKEK